MAASCSFYCLKIPENVLQHVNALLHVLHRDELEPAMEVFAAGAQIGTQQPLIGKSRPVRTAADGNLPRLHSGRFHGSLCPINDLHVGQDALLHIVVAVLDGKLYRACAAFYIQEIGSGGHNRLLGVELIQIVVPKNIFQAALLYLTLHMRQMNEALIAVGILWLPSRRKHGLKFHGKVH